MFMWRIFVEAEFLKFKSAERKTPHLDVCQRLTHFRRQSRPRHGVGFQLGFTQIFSLSDALIDHA